MSSITNERLLVEIGDLIKNMPPRTSIRIDNPENAEWLGRVSAAIESWNYAKTIALGSIIDNIIAPKSPFVAETALRKLTALLHQARSDLLMKMPGGGNVAIPGGMVFAYFEEVRKFIELANQDVLFVDPYLDADFVARFLPYVVTGATIRLLTRYKLDTLLPAVDAYAQQTGRKIEVRSAANLHDRCVLLDGVSCYQSGASFKDGAKSAPTTLTQITDIFPAVQKGYEDMWKAAHVIR